MKLSNTQQKYIGAIVAHASDVGVDINKVNFSRAELRLISMALKGKKWIPNWITHDQSRRVDRGVFSIPEVMESVTPTNVSPGHGSDNDNLADTAPMENPDFAEDNPQSDVNEQAMQEMSI